MWRSKGWARTLGILLGYLGLGMTAVPVVQPYAELVIMAGTALAGAGVVNAGLVKLVK